MSRKRNNYSPEREYTKRLCHDTSNLRIEDQMTSPIEFQLLELKNRRLRDEPPPENYIAPLGKKTVDASDSSASPLLPTVMDFLKGERQVLLVMGDGGSGKTYFLRQLELELWKKYTSSAKDAIPLLFDLSSVERTTSDLLMKVLTREGISEENVRTLKEHSRQLVLLCDGYDEAQVGGNIYNRNNFNKKGHGRVKLIIACRSQKLGSDFDGLFQPVTGDHYHSKNLDQFQKVAMAPFTRSMIEEYVEKYVASPSHLEVQLEAPPLSQSPPAWSIQQYMMALAEIPNLMELVGNPFILSVVLHLLPNLTNLARDDAESPVSFDALYKRVFENWMEVNKRRLYSRENVRDEERAFSELLDNGFAAECLRHMKDLAAEMFKNQSKDVLSVQYTFKDTAKWKDRFLGRDPRTRLLLESMPITRSGKTHRFLFPSLIDYLYSLVVFDPEGSDEGCIDSDGSGTDGFDSDDSARSAEPIYSKSVGGQFLERKRAPQEQQELERGLALKQEHALGFTNISERPMAVQFLADRVQIHQFFKEQLVETVHESSNSGDTNKWLAPNAMAILVRSGMRFNGADLRGIKVKGANLSGGEFDFADVRDSDLRDVTFGKCWLREARLQGAKLQGSKFGESPYTLLDDVPTASAYSPGGTFHAVAFDCGFITIYETSKWTPAFRSKDFPDAITSVAFSPDSKTLAFGDKLGVLRIWKCTTTSIARPLPNPHALCISDITFSSDGSRIATAGQDGTVGIWDTVTGVRIMNLHTGVRCSCVTFSPDGKQLVSGSSDGIIQLWSLDTGVLVSTLKGHSAAISRALFSSDGRQIVSSSSDKTVRVWFPSTTTKVIIFRGHTAAVTGLVYLSDGQLASCSQDSTIRLWDTRSGGSGPVFRGHTDHVVSIAYSQKEAQLVSCGRDKTLRIWDCGAAVKGSILFGRANTKSSGMYPYSVINRDASNSHDTIRSTIPVPRWGHIFSSHSFDKKVTDIATSGDGMLAASASTVNGTPTISIWLSARKAIIKTLTGHLGDISCVVFSPDNQHVASGSADNTIRIWNVQSGAAIRILEGHSNVTSIAYSLNGDQIVSCSEDGTVQLWETSTGNIVRTFDAEDYEIQCVAFSPTGPWVAGGGEDGVVRLWDINSGAAGPVMSGGHDDTVNSVAFSPDGIHVASAGSDNTVRIWNINTGTGPLVLKGHMDPVRCISFSPSGDRVLSGGADRTVKEWDVATGVFLEPLAHTYSVDGLSISSDGAQLWTVSDGRVHVWTNDVFAVKQVAPASSTDFSRDCTQVVWSLGGNKVQLFDVGTGEPGLVFHGDCDTIECVSYSPMHNVIAAASSDSTIQIWESVQGGCLETLQGQGVFTSFIFSPNGMQIAMTTEKMCRLLNLEPEILLKAGNQRDLRQEGSLGSEISNERASAQGFPKLITGYVDHTVEAIASPVYSPDGKEISVGAADSTVLRFPTCSEVESPAPLVGHHDIVTCISYSLLGDKIATGSGDSTARIWDRYAGEQLFLLSGHSGGVTCIAFAPFKDQVATGDNDFTVWLWDLAQSGSGRSLQGHKGSILCVAYSPDGKILASGSADRTMRLWDTNSKICLAEVRDFAAGVESIRWMGKQGGYRLATGSVDNPLGVWELVEDRDETGYIRHHVRRCWGAGVHALAVSGARIGQEHGLKVADANLLEQRKALFTFQGPV